MKIPVRDLAPGVQAADLTADAYPAIGPAQDAWVAWLHQHGIDPARVVIAPIVRDEPARQIRCTVFELDATGHRYLVNERDPEFAKRLLVHQLSAAPAPFPTTS